MRFSHHRHGHGHHQSIRRFGYEEECKERFVRHHRGDPRGGFGGRGEGKRRFFERGEFKFALLELLASEPMHGYQLIKAMEERTGGLYSPSAGSIYPNLQLLEDMNLIESHETDGKKLYHITAQGQEYLRERSQKTEAERPGDRWERHGRHRHPDGRGKHELRELMKEWSDVVFLMARAAQAAQEQPSTEQAAQFHAVMTGLRRDLDRIVGTAAASGGTNEEASKPADDAGTEEEK